MLHYVNFFMWLMFLSSSVFCESSNTSEDIESPPNSDKITEIPYPDVNKTLNNDSNVTTVNISVVNSTSVDKNSTLQRHVSCVPQMGNSEVQIVNDTELIRILIPNPNVTNKETPGMCVVVLFYSKYCPFSSMAAPHFNALPRAFPDVKMVAVNAMIYHLFNTQNGIVGVPSIVLFHNGRPFAKYNESEYTLELFSRFLTKYTGIHAKENSFVTSADFAGPISSVPDQNTDIFLVLSWIFIIICAVYYFGKSKYWKWIVEAIQNTWMESEAQAQHEHND